tara:strand:- start:1825 stop:1929 length:105 start_codon:yes stop_codon:yes gene_type:complete
MPDARKCHFQQAGFSSWEDSALASLPTCQSSQNA